MGDFDINQIQQSSTEGQKPKANTNSRKLLTRLAMLLLVLVVAGGVYFVYSLKYANDPDKLTIGYSTEETFALITLARQKGYFEENEVAIDYRKFKTDQDVLEALNEDKIDLAVVEDIEFVMTLPPQRSQKIIASISSADNYFYILDVKKGLLGTENLIGKSLGMTTGAGNEYWFESNFSAKKDVLLKEVKPNKLARDFADAKLDAVFAKQPLVYQTENFERSGIQALKVSAQGGMSSNTIMVVSEDFLSTNRETLKNFLEVLHRTESFYVEQQEDAEEILFSVWNVEKGYLDTVVKDYQYNLTLNAQLKEVLNSQFEWRKQKRRSGSQTDFVLESIFYYPLLREVKPEAVEF